MHACPTAHLLMSVKALSPDTAAASPKHELWCGWAVPGWDDGRCRVKGQQSHNQLTPLMHALLHISLSLRSQITKQDLLPLLT